MNYNTEMPPVDSTSERKASQPRSIQLVLPSVQRRASQLTAGDADGTSSSSDEDKLVDLPIPPVTEPHASSLFADVMSSGDRIGDRIEAIPERVTLPTTDHVINILRKHFLCHNRHVLKRIQPGSSVSHCAHSVAIGHEYKKLRQCMMSHALLELQRDIVIRLHQFESFVKSLEKMVDEESSALVAINQSADTVDWEEYKTHLIAVSSVCDEFRMHLNHWTCVKQHVYNRRWLRPLIPQLSDQLRSICANFVRLQESAFWWTERLLIVGMQVFAYVDRKSLTYNDVFCIVRGIEEFNALLPLVRIHSHEMRSCCFQVSNSEVHDLVEHSAHTVVDSRHIKSISFSKLLNSLAAEWSKSAVSITKSFLDSSSKLVEKMSRQRFLPADEVLPTTTTHTSVAGTRNSIADSRSVSDPASRKSPLDTHGSSACSDYFSDTGSKMAASLTTPTDIIDFTEHQPTSPLLDFGRKERDYISKVIQITCQRTSLLRKNKFNSAQVTAMTSNSAEADQSNSGFVSDIKRKSVSWGDSQDMSVCRQLTIRYDDSLWKTYGNMMERCLLYEMHWAKPGGRRTGLGSLDMCSHSALNIFFSSLQHASAKGYFTNMASRQLLGLCTSISSLLHIRSCDSKISQCFASLHSDKASPVLRGVNSSQTSHTALLLRQAIKLLCSQLNKSTPSGSGLPLSHPVIQLVTRPGYNDVRGDWMAVSRLETIFELSKMWCYAKSRQYLLSYKMSQFLLIIHGDLLAIHGDLLFCLESFSSSQLKDEIEQMRLKADQLLTFRSTMMKALAGDGDLVAEVYSELILETVLLPIAEGLQYISKDSQLLTLQTVLESIVCDAWLPHFLKNKIKFSVRGTDQLREDFSSILNLIDTYITDEVVKLKLLESRPVKVFKQVISLLSQQKSADDDSLSSCAYRFGLGAPTNKVTPANQMSLPELSVPSTLSEGEKKQWLNLRQHVPGRNPLFPCLSAAI